MGGSTGYIYTPSAAKCAMYGLWNVHRRRAQQVNAHEANLTTRGIDPITSRPFLIEIESPEKS